MGGGCVEPSMFENWRTSYSLREDDEAGLFFVTWHNFTRILRSNAVAMKLPNNMKAKQGPLPPPWLQASGKKSAR